MRGKAALRGRWAVPFLLAAVASGLPAVRPAAAAPAVAAPAAGGPSKALTVLGQSDLGGAGMNGDVAVVDDVAVVGAGFVPHTGFHTERYAPGPCLEVAAKVVDLADPRRPKVAATIPLPPGVAAIDVDALRVTSPQFRGILAAIALDDGPSETGPTGCTPAARNPTFTDRGVVYYDVTKPAAPRLLGRYMADQGLQDDVPQNVLPCGPPPDGSDIRCATGQHSVALVQRKDGRVLSISVEPAADLLVKPSGDVRVVDVTDPAHPLQLGAWPALGQRPASTSANGCDPFTNAHSATFYSGGTRALVAFMDGGLFDLSLGNATTPNMASRYEYAKDRAEEGNAAFASAATVDGQTLAILSEEGWFPSATSLKIDAPASMAGAKFACDALPELFDQARKAQLYGRPDGTVAGQIAYGGRGCPARGTGANPVAEDPYPMDPAGRIVLLDPQRVQATQPDITPGGGCNIAIRVARAQAAGASAVILARSTLAPFAAAPQTLAWGSDPAALTVPVVLLDEPDAAAIRTALCPGLTDGRCNPPAQPVTGSLVAAPGQWGGLRVLEVDPDTGMRQLAVLRSPHGTTFPPPDLGVYAPGRSTVVKSLAYVAWHADGLRVIDLAGEPMGEVAHFVPADTPDPTNAFPAKASVEGVAVTRRFVLVSDQNSGLYVLSPLPAGGGKAGAITLVLVAVSGAVLLAVVILLGRRRRRRPEGSRRGTA